MSSVLFFIYPLLVKRGKDDKKLNEIAFLFLNGGTRFRRKRGHPGHISYKVLGVVHGH